MFNETLLPKTKPEEETEQNSFVKINLYALRYDKENKIDICDKNEFENLIDEKLIDQLDEEKYKVILDFKKFNNNCYEINYLLSKYNYFLRVIELKSKFRYLTMKDQKKKFFSGKFQVALLKNTMVFKQYELNLSEEKEKTLNRLIESINRQEIQKLVRFVIIKKTFQKHIQIFIM